MALVLVGCGSPGLASIQGAHLLAGCAVDPAPPASYETPPPELDGAGAVQLEHLYAQITGGTNPYSWQELLPGDLGSWVVGPRSGLAAWTLSGLTTVPPGEVVAMTPGFGDNWYFPWGSGSSGPASSCAGVAIDTTTAVLAPPVRRDSNNLLIPTAYLGRSHCALVGESLGVDSIPVCCNVQAALLIVLDVPDCPAPLVFFTITDSLGATVATTTAGVLVSVTVPGPYTITPGSFTTPTGETCSLTPSAISGIMISPGAITTVHFTMDCNVVQEVDVAVAVCTTGTCTQATSDSPYGISGPPYCCGAGATVTLTGPATVSGTTGGDCRTTLTITKAGNYNCCITLAPFPTCCFNVFVPCGGSGGLGGPITLAATLANPDPTTKRCCGPDCLFTLPDTLTLTLNPCPGGLNGAPGPQRTITLTLIRSVIGICGGFGLNPTYGYNTQTCVSDGFNWWTADATIGCSGCNLLEIRWNATAYGFANPCDFCGEPYPGIPGDPLSGGGSDIPCSSTLDVEFDTVYFEGYSAPCISRITGSS